MFKHTGKMLQTIAQGAFWVLSVASVVLGIVLIATMAETEIGIVMGVLVLILGPFAAYVASLVLYGYGTIVRKCENDEDGGRSGSEQIKPNPRPKRSFLDLIGLETVGDTEENPKRQPATEKRQTTPTLQRSTGHAVNMIQANGTCDICNKQNVNVMAVGNGTRMCKECYQSLISDDWPEKTGE